MRGARTAGRALVAILAMSDALLSVLRDILRSDPANKVLEGYRAVTRVG